MTPGTLHTVEGTLFYRQRIALPPEAAVAVEIVYQPTDKHQAPVPIGYQGFQTAGKQVPLTFSVPYDESEIDGRRNYFIQARIDHPTPTFCFVNAAAVQVITHGRPVREVAVPLRQAAGPTAAVVTGAVTHNEFIVLPPEWVMRVQLLDVSRLDAPATVLGEQQITCQGRQVPLPFTITYDPAAIDDRFSYSVSARIEDSSGALRMISDTHTPVITRGSPSENVEVIVRSV